MTNIPTVSASIHDEYLTALKRGQIVGSRCAMCEYVMVPPVPVCMECGHHEMQTEILQPFGTILSYTVIRMPPEGFTAPYVVALVRLEEGPWVMGQLAVNPDEVGAEWIGQRVVISCEVSQRGPFGSERAFLTFQLPQSGTR